MPRRDQSGEGSKRKPAGRSGARTKSSRSDSPRGERSSSGGDSKKPFKSTRSGSKSFSKPTRGGKPYGRSKDESSDKPAGNFRKRSSGAGFSARSEKPFTRSRDDRDDTKRPSRFSDKGDSKDFSKPRRSYDRKDDSSERPSRGDKPFGRSNDDSSERPSRGGNFKRRSEGGDTPREQKSFSRSRDDRDDTKRTSKFSEEGESKRSKFSDKEERGDKKGFFSKLSRGGKSFTRTAAPAPDYGKTIEKGKEDFGTTEKIRLNRYISNSGVCSRREADELIKMGLVTVNGTVVTEMGHKVDRKDVIKYDGKTLRAEKPVYILMNKPKGFLTTTKDPQDRNTVMQIIAESVKERVYPVGRLDRNTTGLLLLTNDGELTDKLSHPSYNVKKIYKVDLDKPLTKADFEKIKAGVRLEEGKAMVDDLAMVSDDGKTIGIELHIGWNRVVRRIFESLGYEVVKLDRSVYAGLDKKELSRGHWRHLTREEVVRLKHYK
jgi:23S rRNA pseudouridine2605 synthase